MASADPFDFSDFGGTSPGPAARPAVTGTTHAESAAAGAFDPFADQPARTPQLSDGDAFGDIAPPPAHALTVSRPPVALLAAAVAAAAIGVMLGVIAISRGALGSGALFAFIGWLLAGPAAIGILAWFSAADTRRRISSVYSAPGWLPAVYWAALAVCATGIGLGAWQIALWAGRY